MLRSAGNLLVLVFVSLFLLQACSPPPPPQNVESICSIFKEYPKWYWQARKTEKKWGVPVSVQMAIIHQESGFDGKAKPDRTKLLWVVPWKRPSSAYGYSQALKTTWENYANETGKNGRRDNFSVASDFIGWYADRAYREAGISKKNATQLYLAYHEGVGGYQRGTYKKKTWLVNVSKKVGSRASVYESQLRVCKSKIKKPLWRL